MSLREALALGHNYIGTEHILLAVLQFEEASDHGRALTGLGVTPERAREWLTAEIERIAAARNAAAGGQAG